MEWGFVMRDGETCPHGFLFLNGCCCSSCYTKKKDPEKSATAASADRRRQGMEMRVWQLACRKMGTIQGRIGFIEGYQQGAKDANEEAYKIIKEAKRKWAPNTTNSEADDWLKSYEKKLGEE